MWLPQSMGNLTLRQHNASFSMKLDWFDDYGVAILLWAISLQRRDLRSAKHIAQTRHKRKGSEIQCLPKVWNKQMLVACARLYGRSHFSCHIILRHGKPFSTTNFDRECQRYSDLSYDLQAGISSKIHSILGFKQKKQKKEKKGFLLDFFCFLQ